MIINSLQSHITDGCEISWLLHIPTMPLFAQTITDPDVVGSIQRAFTHFIETGQVWALLIGIILGYLLRGMTTYG